MTILKVTTNRYYWRKGSEIESYIAWTDLCLLSTATFLLLSFPVWNLHIFHANIGAVTHDVGKANRHLSSRIKVHPAQSLMPTMETLTRPKDFRNTDRITLTSRELVDGESGKIIFGRVPPCAACRITKLNSPAEKVISMKAAEFKENRFGTS